MQARGIRQADGVLLSRFAYAQWVLGCPLQNPAQPTPTVPPPPLSQMGPPASTCTVFRSNDLKIWGSLSKVRHPGSVRMVRVIIGLGGLSRGGRFWLRVLF